MASAGWLLGLAWAIAAPAAAHVLQGEVVRVTDGDTLWVRTAPKVAPMKVRLQGLDAPERCQPWGPEAKGALSARVLHRTVRVQTRARDAYGRTVARVLLQGDDVGAWMVRQGHAWSARYHRSAGPYARQEDHARAARLGLFAADHPVEPRQFRRQHGPCDAQRSKR